jgi:GT2 family glycosyltransferase
MRPLALICLLSLAGCVGSARVEGFAASGPTSFFYSAHTNTVMTANDDGAAERLRRGWIADALQAHAMCGQGYAVDTRHYVPDADGPFGNGGDILYAGRCL